LGAGGGGAVGCIKRGELARIAFGDGRVEELNAIVHPATMARQAELIAEIAAKDAGAVVVVESALIFETKHAGERGDGSAGIARRFDKVIFVKAAEGLRITRFVERMAHGEELTAERRAELEADARRRMARQSVEANEGRSDFVLVNEGSVEELQEQVDGLWGKVAAMAQLR